MTRFDIGSSTFTILHRDILLILLLNGPKHTYAITNLLNNYYRNLGKEKSYSGIYKAVEILSENGLLEDMTPDGDKSVYGITEKGKRVVAKTIRTDKHSGQVTFYAASTPENNNKIEITGECLLTLNGKLRQKQEGRNVFFTTKEGLIISLRAMENTIGIEADGILSQFDSDNPHVKTILQKQEELLD